MSGDQHETTTTEEGSMTVSTDMPVADDESKSPRIPWRVFGLDGASTNSGRTYDGGSWTGGGPHTDKSLGVRVYSPYFEPASVEVDFHDLSHGCTVTLTPALAREYAAAVVAAADLADAEMEKWRAVAEKQRASFAAYRLRDAEGRAGLTPPDATAEAP